ncbi:MAG: TetR family transcriptional regulator [Actinobacteria bacterium]|nr:TetR family transcriptional regulator [Actinomycetota bacterium]
MSAEQTRARILEAACELISEEGIDGIRIARVANRARVSTSLVHHYFSTREELLTDALMLAFDLAASERFGDEAGLVEIEGAGHTEALALAIDQCLPDLGPSEHEWTLWVELWLRGARDPELRPVANRLYQRYRGWMLSVIEAGVDAGEFDCDDPERVADLAIGVIDGLGLRVLLRDPGMDLERARTTVAAVLAAELGVSAEPDGLTATGALV